MGPSWEHLNKLGQLKKLCIVDKTAIIKRRHYFIKIVGIISQFFKMLKKVYTVIILGVLLKCVSLQTVRVNPCPNVFQYFQENGIVYGRMEFQNDYSGYYQLTVNMSTVAYLQNNQNIRLELRTPATDLIRGRPVTYNVYFPFQGVIPKPTRIEFNQRIYCIGPPEEVKPGTLVTNMWASTFYRITSPVNPNDSDYEIQVIEITLPEVTPPTEPFTDILLSPGTIPPLFTSSQLSTQNPFPVSTLGPGVTVIDKNSVEGQCGFSTIKTQEAALNGNITDGQFPWLVAILYRQSFNYKYRCTGSLVSNRHVITAGHCIRYNKALLSPFKDLVLVFGKHDIENWANGAVLGDVQSISVHPEYKQNKGDSDIAVITITKPIVFDPTIKPVCLWQEDDDLDKVVGMEGTVVGWGRDETGNEVIADATKVNLPIVSQTVCRTSHSGFSSITSSKTFCAGDRNGVGPCHGDIGAGLVMNRNGKWTLRGVVSTGLGGLGSCDLKNYIVFVDIAKFKNWIKEAMT